MNPTNQTNPQPAAPAPPQGDPPPPAAPQLIQDIPVRHSQAPAAPRPVFIPANPISSPANPLQQPQADAEPAKARAAELKPQAAHQHKSHLGLTIFVAVCAALLLGFLAFLVYRQG